jgi:hypothetical protein
VECDTGTALAGEDADFLHRVLAATEGATMTRIKGDAYVIGFRRA